MQLRITIMTMRRKTKKPSHLEKGAKNLWVGGGKTKKWDGKGGGEKNKSVSEIKDPEKNGGRA